MRNATRVLGFASALAFLAGTAAAQNSNDSSLNNGADVVYLYSSPSSGFSAAAFPPDATGDLYWRAHSGAGFMRDATNTGGVVTAQDMEIDGYFESLFDTDWSTPPDFYGRLETLAYGDLAGTGYLEPAFFQDGFLSGVYVALGNSGFGNPCTSGAPSLCSPSGGTCPPPGFVNGYLVDITFGATVGSGIVLPADGTAASNLATVYFVPGGMLAAATLGACGLGDYSLQDLHSTDETQADPNAGLPGINPSGGLQIAGSGSLAEGINSMAEGHEAWRGNIVNVVADSGSGVEVGDNGGGAMNGRNLAIGSGLASIGVELRDLGSATTLAGVNLAVVAASASPFPPTPILGGVLLIAPIGLFNTTSSVWNSPPPAGVVPVSFNGFTSEGAFAGIQLGIPSSLPSALTLHIQGAVIAFPAFTVNSTNAVTCTLIP
jgi:hypothetical protein